MIFGKIAYVVRLLLVHHYGMMALPWLLGFVPQPNLRNLLPWLLGFVPQPNLRNLYAI
jgi:hypothetical protein